MREVVKQPLMPLSDVNGFVNMASIDQTFDDRSGLAAGPQLRSLANGQQLIPELSWSGVIVRKIDCRFAVRMMQVAVLTVLVGTQQSSAQTKVARLPQPAAEMKPQPSAAQPAVAPDSDAYLDLIDRAITVTSKRTLTANSHSPWQIFHYVLAMRTEGVLRLGNEKVNAIDWISTAEPKFDKEPWLLLTHHGAKFHPYTKKYYFEGHPAQFLALLSHSNLPMDHKFRVQGKDVTLQDLVNNTMKEVNSKEEVTWVLWALQHFLPPDATWVNQHNEAWSIERLVQIESDAPVVKTPCGGNHRLFALTKTRDKYLQQGGKLRGVWLQADQKIRQHIELARSLQNPDGSFSSAFYGGPGHSTDVNTRFNTSGHTMEFLSISLPKERLNEPWVRSAVWTLSRELVINQNTEIDCGPLFHSLDALILYRERLRAAKAETELQKKPLEMAHPSPETPISLNLKLNSEPIKLIEISRPTITVEKATTPEKSAPSAKEIVQNPQEPKLSAPISEPIPIPEPKPISDTKTPPDTTAAQPKANPPKPLDTTAKVRKSEPAKTASSSAKPNLIKIDPARLANVGQAAPQLKPVDQKTNPPSRVALRDKPANGAPALLPDSVATPLVEPELIVAEIKLPKEESAKTDADCSEVADASAVVTVDTEQPASALIPSNVE